MLHYLALSKKALILKNSNFECFGSAKCVYCLYAYPVDHFFTRVLNTNEKKKVLFY